MPPPVNLGANWHSMQGMPSIPEVPEENEIDNANGINNVENGNQPPVNPPDPIVGHVVVDGVGPDLLPGNEQAQNFADNHTVSVGYDWDLNTPKGMLETAQKAIVNIKTVITGEDKFVAFKSMLDDAVRNAIDTNTALNNADRSELVQLLTECKTAMNELQMARAELTAAVKDGSDIADPRKGLAQIRKTLRAFRYEMQCELSKRGYEAGKMGFNEGNLRAIQNAFTFVGSKVTETFARVMELESRLDDAFTELRNAIHAANRGSVPLQMPANVKLANAAGEALELSHLTNDRIRDFQDMDATSSTLRGIVSKLAEKGGSRKVEFTAGVGALIGLGFSSAFSAGVRVGMRYRVIGEISSQGKGTSISVTFRMAGGLEAKAGIKAGEESFSPDAKAQVVAGVEGSRFVTRSYLTVEDLILDANRCKLATSRTIGMAVWGGIKSLGKSIYGLGRSVFRWLGRKSGEVKQDNAAYLQSLKARGIAGELDRLLAKRVNPVIVEVRKGWTVGGQAEASANASVVKDVLDMGLSGNMAREKDFRVKGKIFTSLARAARNARDVDALNALMRPGPAGGNVPPITHFNGNSADEIVKSIDEMFEVAIHEGEEVAKLKIGPLRSPDKVGFARVANMLRSLMLATELAVREGKIPREAADTLFERYGNPPFKFPTDVFREYLMVDIGASKPAKIRNSASLKLQIGLFTGWSNGMTEGIGSSIIKAVADGAVKEMRHQIGLDTTFQYRFSSEKPARPGEDPRPWENTVKTSHELAITASTPIRVLIDAITRTVVNKGERLENKSQSVAKDTAKGVVKDLASDIPLGVVNSTIVGLLLASVKETAIAAVKSWLSKPENIAKLLVFIIENAGSTIETILDVIQWACEHPEATKLILGTIKGTSLIAESERAKVIKWSFTDGKLDTIAVNSEVSSKLGVNVDPVGVGLGAGFDISYSVTESVKERSLTPRPTLVMLLEKGEQFLLGETGLATLGTGEAFRNWLSRNANGVVHMLDHMLDDENREKTLELYNQALLAADGDIALQERLQDTWREVQALPADATLDEKVGIAHKLITAMVLAYHV